VVKRGTTHPVGCLRRWCAALKDFERQFCARPWPACIDVDAAVRRALDFLTIHSTEQGSAAIAAAMSRYCSITRNFLRCSVASGCSSRCLSGKAPVGTPAATSGRRGVPAPRDKNAAVTARRGRRRPTKMHATCEDRHGWTWIDFFKMPWSDPGRSTRSGASSEALPRPVHSPWGIMLKDPDCELTLGRGVRGARAILYCRKGRARQTHPTPNIRIGADSFIGHYCNLRTGGASSTSDETCCWPVRQPIAPATGFAPHSDPVAGPSGRPVSGSRWCLDWGFAVVLPGYGWRRRGHRRGRSSRTTAANAIVAGNPARICDIGMRGGEADGAATRYPT